MTRWFVQLAGNEISESLDLHFMEEPQIIGDRPPPLNSGDTIRAQYAAGGGTEGVVVRGDGDEAAVLIGSELWRISRTTGNDVVSPIRSPLTQAVWIARLRILDDEYRIRAPLGTATDGDLKELFQTAAKWDLRDQNAKVVVPAVNLQSALLMAREFATAGKTVAYLTQAQQFRLAVPEAQIKRLCREFTIRDAAGNITKPSGAS